MKKLNIKSLETSNKLNYYRLLVYMNNSEDLQRQISEYLSKPDKAYKRFEVDISDKLKNAVDKFDIQEPNTFDHYGYSDKIDLEKLDKFLLDLGQNDKESLIIIQKFIVKLLKKVCDGYDKDSAWLKIGVSLPHHSFDIPRWHTDGRFFEKVEGEFQSKFVMVIKGPGTLFCDPNKEIRKKFFDAFIGRADMNKRLELQEILKSEKVIQMPNNQGAIFLVGDQNYSAIHSEPPMTEPRIFISILPGTNKQIIRREEMIIKRREEKNQ
jgi:hypothetical protein